ncbi:unnamed protein product [Caenorhabditis angaria]|uniref:Uncharacterized protein n=1 Tax=Caenorhabditis angaria TaxID=860376 RepID=A0A9P1I795_9PELO|nr:unnamed protein product [Caenorhabditis angaria]
MSVTELKAGHAPAEKVGGRRVVNRKDRKYSDSMDSNQNANHYSNSESSDDGIRELIDVDLPAKMERSYPTVSVKKSHEKPIPTLQATRSSRSTRGTVQQPRKQTH